MAAGDDPLRRRTTGEAPLRRVVLLGASNLTRALPVVLDHARHAWGAPLEVLAALGHGRSYGLESRVLGRSLPGILQSGLWPALAARQSGEVAALVTDVGNDIVYGARPAAILEWIAECLTRLAVARARTVITLLPLAGISALPPWRYRLLRTLLFPGCRLSFADALDCAFAVQTGLVALAARFGAVTIEPHTTWYRFDPIHLARGVWPEAWSEIFSGWENAAPGTARVAHAKRHALYFLSLWPEQQRLFGFRQRFAQPCGTLGDGTTIALY